MGIKTAKDGAISIPQYGLHITALTFEEAHVIRIVCAVEGTCCEEDTPT